VKALLRWQHPEQGRLMPDDLRLRVVAEGVETEEVCDRLSLLGCDAAQGFFIHRPAPVVNVANWMERRLLAL
jgi:EAL domain-containing protein (putative c-di-GMP-specific phosphodiesterase class I)